MSILSGTNSKIGVSLIELMLASGLLAAIMIPVMLTFSSSSMGIQMTSEELIAHSAAMELLEQTMAAPFELLPLGKFTNDDIKDQRRYEEGASPLKFRISPVKDVEIRREMNISSVMKDNKIRFKKVEVDVSWSTRESKTAKRTISLKALLANEKE